MLFDLTLGRASQYWPRAVAIIDGERSVTFGELNQRVCRLAALLHHKGFRAGDRVAFLLPNCLEFVEVLFTCLRLGLIAVPLNTRLTVSELDAILEDSGARGMVRHRDLPLPNYPAEWQVTVGEEPMEGMDGDLPSAPFDPELVLGLFYTSGTTGVAKGVMLTHANWQATVHHFSQFIRMDRNEVWMHAAPMFHVADFPLMLSAVQAGARQVTLPRFEPASFCKAVEQHGVTQTLLIPTMLNFITLHPELGAYDLSSLHTVLYGGSPIAPEVISRVRQKLPKMRLVQGYGATETASGVVFLMDSEHDGPLVRACGRPARGVAAEIVNEDGRPVAQGESGEVIVRSPSVMKGYWNKPEETAKAFFGKWYRTGDVAVRDEEGYIFIVDRAKDMIVTGGENVYSTEVEAVIYGHPAIREAAVIGTPHETWGELVTACVSFRDGATACSEELTQFCKQRLAGYKVPKRWEFFAPELPKNGTGKILKRELRAPFWKDQARQVG